MFKGAAIVMGVTSCGKSSVGEAIAVGLGLAFAEGDKLHPASNISKMSSGTPLTDDDRWPWLAKVGQSLQGQMGRIASCSALKRSYRNAIASEARRPVAFVFLDGDDELLKKRIEARQGHFMPPTLLASQLATLERPGPDELARAFDIRKPITAIAAEACAWLEQLEV